MGGYPHPDDDSPEMEAIYQQIRPCTKEEYEDALAALPEEQRKIVEEYHSALRDFHENALAEQARTRRIHKPKPKA